jgi:hypothetical protein
MSYIEVAPTCSVILAGETTVERAPAWGSSGVKAEASTGLHQRSWHRLSGADYGSGTGMNGYSVWRDFNPDFNYFEIYSELKSDTRIGQRVP